MLSTTSNHRGTHIGFGENRCRITAGPKGAEKVHDARLRIGEGEICFFWQGYRTNEKMPSGLKTGGHSCAGIRTERLPKQAPEQTPALALPLPRGSTAGWSWRERSRR